MNNRRHFLKQAITSSLMFQIGCSIKDPLNQRLPLTEPTPTPTPTPSPTPSIGPDAHPGANNNILFIAVDDLNDWLGCFNAQIAPGIRPFTPNIDFFASQAMLFENAYTPIALCNPVRSAVFYGAQPYLSGVMNNTTKQTSEFHPGANCYFDNRTSLNAAFKAKHYETIGVGKLYHGSRMEVTDGTFEKYYDALGKNPGHCKIAHLTDMPGKPMAAKVDPGTPKQGCPNGIQHIDAYIENIASRELDRFAARGDAGRPFFLGVGFQRPHAPYYAPTWCWDKYSRAAIKTYLNTLFPAEANLIPEGILSFFSLRVEIQNRQFDKDQLADYLHGYLAAITYVDSLMGKLLDKLRSSHLWKNTTVVFWSDHGYHFGEKQLQAKNTLWERATKVPLIVRVPGLNEGTRTNSLVSTLGLYNTLTEMTLKKKQAGVEGESFYAVLKDPSAEPSDAVISAVSMDGDTDSIESIKSVGYTVREKDWRYMLYRILKSDGTVQMVEELYDVKNDPGERTNLIKNGRGPHSSVCERMENKIPKAFGQRAPLPRLNCE